MTSLGKMLQARIEQEEQAEISRKLVEAAEKQAKVDLERQMVETYFDNVRKTIVSVITHGGKMPTFTIGKRDGWVCDSYDLSTILQAYQWSDTTPQGSIQDTSHRFYDVWAKFRDWANENDLSVGFEYDHDGMGRESWYVLTVKPQ
jgi:hypothetical protein